MERKQQLESHMKFDVFLNKVVNDPEMKELAARSGFELVNIGVPQMDAFMKERIQLYTTGAARLGLGRQ
jgi:hypothetical protein